MAAGYMTMKQHPNCCETSAAACTSARICRVLDTVILAVSIFVLILVKLLLGLE